MRVRDLIDLLQREDQTARCEVVLDDKDHDSLRVNRVTHRSGWVEIEVVPK